jgi:hypothetical protein
MMKIINEGDGYKVRATAKKVGTFKVVAFDWEHPNYGYFADALLWINSPHLDNWTPYNIAGWTKKYDVLEKFLDDYPEFSEFFEFDSLDEITKASSKELDSPL